MRKRHDHGNKNQQHFQHMPIPLTPLFGRENEEQAVHALLKQPEVRLLTLIGPPGVGKTRLALQVGAHLADQLPHGVCFVELSDVSDPDEFLPTLARAYGLPGSRGIYPAAQLTTFLHGKQRLLLLDNFEQILPAACALPDLLSACPTLKILVTSRARLHVQGEYEFPVPALVLPQEHLITREAVARSPAIALFVQRTQMVQPDFQLTDQNATALAEICRRLDGLPFALELAAARMKLLSPHALLARLTSRLTILNNERQDVPPRQQSLRETLRWSYDLLSREEQRLFRRLCVFTNGCTLEAAEAVATSFGDRTTPILDLVTALIDKSLLSRYVTEYDEPRPGLLTTVREYGLEQLDYTGELETARKAHAHYYLTFARQAERALYSGEQALWLARSETELENIRAALAWLLEHHERCAALQLASDLLQFWILHRRISEGLQYLKQALALRAAHHFDEYQETIEANALYAAGRLAFLHNDTLEAFALLEESLRWQRALHNGQGIARCLAILGRLFYSQDDIQSGRTMVEKALRLSRHVRDQRGTAETLFILGSYAHYQGRSAQATVWLQDCLTLARAQEDIWLIAATLYLLSWISYLQATYDEARHLSEESVTLFRSLGHPCCAIQAMTVLGWTRAAQGDEGTGSALLVEALSLGYALKDQEGALWAHYGSGHLALQQGKLAEAQAHFEQSALLTQDQPITPPLRWLLATCLEGLGEIARARGQVSTTVHCFAAAQAIRQARGYDTPLGREQSSYNRTLSAARARLGEQAFASAWARGLSMTPAQALNSEANMLPMKHGPDQLIVTEVSSPSEAPTELTLSSISTELTVRETEVLRLIASGLSSNEVASCLVLSSHTVNAHIRSIYRKLGVNSRSAATRYAIEHHCI